MRKSTDLIFYFQTLVHALFDSVNVSPTNICLQHLLFTLSNHGIWHRQQHQTPHIDTGRLKWFDGGLFLPSVSELHFLINYVDMQCKIIMSTCKVDKSTFNTTLYNYFVMQEKCYHALCNSCMVIFFFHVRSIRYSCCMLT